MLVQESGKGILLIPDSPQSRFSIMIIGFRKNIYLQGIDGAVIRDVLIFMNTTQSMPDETDNTVWNLTARAYLDSGSDSETGILTLRKADSDASVSVPVTLSTNAAKDPQDVSLIVPVILKYLA